jgi:hypothetical protein
MAAGVSVYASLGDSQTVPSPDGPLLRCRTLPAWVWVLVVTAGLAWFLLCASLGIVIVT